MQKITNQPSPAVEAFRKALDKSILANQLTQEKRTYLGGSMIGTKCSRQLAYSYHAIPTDLDHEFPPHILRIFHMGHDGEARMENYLSMAGFQVHTRTGIGQQYGVSEFNERFQGHLDGAIKSGPEIPGLVYPALWENKCLGNKTFNEFEKNGLKKSNEKYWAQAHIYMYLAQLNSCLFTCLNRDSGEVSCEVIPLDNDYAHSLLEKAERIVHSRSPDEFKRAGESSDDYSAGCKWCPYRERCWSLNTKTPTIVNNSLAWLGKLKK
jgi:hypothetical protein